MSSGLSLAGNGSFQDEPEREPEVSSRLDHLKAGGQRDWRDLRLQRVGNVDRARVEISSPRESKTESNSVKESATNPKVSVSHPSSSSACRIGSGMRSCSKSAMKVEPWGRTKIIYLKRKGDAEPYVDLWSYNVRQCLDVQEVLVVVG